MTVLDLFYYGVLLLAVGVIGFIFARSKSKAEQAPTNQTAISASDDASNEVVDKEVETLRAIHQVNLVDEKDEGSGIAHLPNGVFGYSYSPQQETPLFRKKMFQSFEVHKLPDGQIHLIGFVTEREAVQLSAAGAYVEVNLYPEPWGESAKAVSIPTLRVLHARGPSRSDGNALKLELAPESDTIH